MELHELQVGDPGPGPQRGRHPVTRRDRRVGGRRVDLAEATGGEHDRPAVGRADAVDLALADDVQRHAAHRTVVGGEQVDDQCVLDDLDARVVDDAVQGGDERARDLGAGGVTAGVRDPVAVVAALAGQLDLAAGVAVELGAQRHELAHPVGSLGHQDAHRLGVAQPDAGHERVVEVLLRRVLGVEGSGDAALGPLGRAGRQHGLGHQQHPVDPLAQPQGAGEAGDARADHDDVGAGGPAGLGGTEPPGQRDGRDRHPAQTSARACGTSENTSSAPPPGPTSSGVLSISRVVPTRAATASSASPRYHSGTSARVCGCTSTR